ncbi:uncharacterized protein PITG_17114 [Phytophthora infestans T30-4]|uniref:Endonuclease/exonuclease/phosphatase family domain-containing protein 1 n=2 Tax=Phytophthora infestans TaxID=4787 RepID=D0NV24_PHYIT|nr:uncharacterized protein PITG_17114 [Phytophthora infestans T30-4]EEY66496.1 conserved hypothetical protein [Phytophthora infestans T30-4]KAF4027640.1 Endonuclease/Exonuclease/phosphatase family [Phytophthora infestans]KAF4030540.1 Endonuclease/Exonuclease/phosphatase family [Phytophthora infestans]KAF4143935.1 Endonuclease/Exonuclease/phosphatase family [Phytophthora infestans]|eukprot:XP_002897015.1 conserved hypothetical protein [Phytophthora infestans T30-4]
MDLNTATTRELQQLPGVGSVTARLIIESRPFSCVEDLLRVKGIGPVKFAAITAENQIYVDEKPTTIASTKLNIKIDLNAASKRQLQQFKGVGPVLAQRIVEARPFHRKEDLLAVKGIGPKSYVKIQAGAHVRSSSDPFDRGETGDDNGEDSGEERVNIDETFHVCREIERDIRGNIFPTNMLNHNDNNRALLVASWNIRNISRRKEIFLLERIADILKEFDIVALQEVRDLIVLKRLKTMLPGWDYVVSEPVGRMSPGAKKRVERYAFFYRRSAARLVEKCWLVEGSSDVFTRLPCVATFRATKESGVTGLELALINVHVSFAEKESRHAEIAEISRLANELSASVPINRKVVVLGDFNLSPQDVLGSLGSHKMALIRSPLSTTVFGKLYDNIWLDRADFSNCNIDKPTYCVDSGVLRVDWRFYPPSKGTCSRRSAQHPMDTMLPRLQTYMSRVQCGYELSDHCPVWVAFTAASKRDGTSAKSNPKASKP